MYLRTHTHTHTHTHTRSIFSLAGSSGMAANAKPAASDPLGGQLACKLPQLVHCTVGTAGHLCWPDPYGSDGQRVAFLWYCVQSPVLPCDRFKLRRHVGHESRAPGEKDASGRERCQRARERWCAGHQESTCLSMEIKDTQLSKKLIKAFIR